MVIFKKVAHKKDWINTQRQNGGIGFVPTMGALHQGHLSLVKQAKDEGGIAVASIFVNPTQFNDKEDFAGYPSSIAEDIVLLEQAGCDALLLPSVDEIYPDGTGQMPSYDFGYLDTILEGAHRPGHFKGVGQVVARLLEIVQPDVLYMGQKDYQQCMVIKNLIAQIDKTDDIKMVIIPTIREADGLAMSSRNRRLTEPQRALAGLLYQCLVSVQAKQQGGSFAIVEKECRELLAAKGLEPEYVALADANDLTLLTDFDPSRKMVALIAARLGAVRLIDNMLLN